LQAAELGLTLGSESRDTLTVEPASKCPPEFADALRVHKWHLLAMLSWPFCMVYSKALDETIFFAEDEATKAALIEAGADQWSIYTRDELKILLEQNRVAPFSDDELRKLCEIKRTFNVRITGQDAFPDSQQTLL
jgi:hypothetical protein